MKQLLMFGLICSFGLVSLLERATAGEPSAMSAQLSVAFDSLDVLASALNSADVNLETKAADLLVRLGKPSLVPLVQALGNPNTRSLAAASLDRLQEPLGTLFLKTLAGDAPALAALAARKDPRVPALLLQVISEGNPMACAAAIQALGRLGEHSVQPLLLKLLSNPSVSIRASVAQALQRLGNSEAIAPLLALLKDPEPSVVAAAQVALLALRHRSGGLAAFRELASGPDLWNRWRAVRYLVRGPEGLSEPFLTACTGVLLSQAGLAWALGALGVGAVLALGTVRLLRPSRVPGLAGWLLLANVWMAALLYWPAWVATLGSVGFLLVALVPTWAVLGVSVLVGALRWRQARARLAGFVCRNDYHRFVAGPRLGWLERWTGRLLFKQRGGGLKDLAGDSVCRACGHSQRFEGVKQVVAVLDHPSAVVSGPEQGVLKVNWLKYGKPFDFERVELDRTGATEVENFVQQSRFQADETVRQGLRKMVCVVGSRARLEDKTLRVLRPVFGEVVEEEAKS